MRLSEPARRLDVLICAMLFALALMIRLWYGRGFDGLYGQDAYAYYQFAAQLVRGEMFTPYYWGIGYPLVMAVGFALFGVSPIVSQTISLLMGAALAPMLYVFAHHLGLTGVACFTAGIVIAVCGQAIQSSFVTMSDIPALFWAVSSALCLFNYAKSQRAYWLIAATALLAFAGLTRWLYFALIPAWGYFLLVMQKRICVRATLLAILTAGIILLPQLIFSAIHPIPVFNHVWVENWSTDHVFQRDFNNADGEFHYANLNVAFYAAPLIDPYYLSPLFAVLIPFGIWNIPLSRTAAAFLILWILLPYLFLVGIPYQNIRFPLISVPPIAVLCGGGVEWWWRRFPRQRWLLPLLGVSGIALTIPVVNSTLLEFTTRQIRDTEMIQWAETLIPNHAIVYTLGLTLPLQRIHDGEVRELYYETPDTLQVVRDRRESVYLLINRWQIEHQWQGRSPAIAVQWLTTHRGTRRIWQNGNYTLFELFP